MINPDFAFRRAPRLCVDAPGKARDARIVRLPIPCLTESNHEPARADRNRQGLLICIKVDTGAKDHAAHPGEKVTESLDGLRERLQAYFEMGARFAKWRGVIVVSDSGLGVAASGGLCIPSRGCMEANAHTLARYAGRAVAQQALLHRARCNRAAVKGEYHAAMETA